jgi:cytochrome c-type biogenesis protein CcmH
MIRFDPAGRKEKWMAKTMRKWLTLLLPRYLLAGIPLLILTLWLLSTAALHAQANTPTPSAPTNVTADNVTADQVNAVARELWCPLCSGVRLDACELKACAQMKEMIATKLAAGEDLDSIRSYFVAQYGPQVLGEPPWEGFNWLAWVLPFVVLAIGGYFLWQTMRRMMRPAAVTATTSSANEPEDEYERKLAEELKRYG